MARIGEFEGSALNAAAPGYVFVLRSLLFPMIAVIDLAACAVIRGQSFSGRYFLLATLAFLLTSLVLDRAHVHSLSDAHSWHSELVDIIAHWLLIAGLSYGLIELGGLSRLIGYPVLWLWVTTTPFLMWSAQRVVRAILCRGFPGNAPQRAVIVGVTDVGKRLESRIKKTPVMRTRVIGYLEDRAPERLPPMDRCQIVGKMNELRDFVLKQDVNIVYITIPLSRQRRITDLIDSLCDSTVSIYFVPDLFVFNLIQARIDALGGIPLIAVRESPFYAGRIVAKRLEDILLAAIAVLLLSPILLIAAIGVKLTSRGPVLFKQLRYGLDGRSILIYKFRSMRVMEDGSEYYTQVTRGDTRVTRFGSLLRKTSIDELPQLLNVLEGTMSIVGPRPHVVAVNEQYRRLIPEYMIRHKVRPGITGWAQVNGCRGGDDLESMTKRVECDLEYLRSWSMGLDFRIIIRTAMLMLRDREAF
jgi:putative colanic acid biosysnthesis UDP-glucose lipid carrier transferase